MNAPFVGVGAGVCHTAGSLLQREGVGFSMILVADDLKVKVSEVTAQPRPLIIAVQNTFILCIFRLLDSVGLVFVTVMLGV